MVYSSYAATSIAPIVYTRDTYNYTTNNSSHSVFSVNSDGSNQQLLQSSGFNQTQQQGEIASRGRYSPNRTFVAWTTYDGYQPGNTGKVAVRDMSNTNSKADATKRYNMPVGETSANVQVQFAWYPDNRQILVQTWNGSANKFSLWVLDTSTGRFTLKFQLPYTDNWSGIKSMVVLGNNRSVVLTDNGGVKFLAVGATSLTVLKQSSELTSCDKVRAKPGTLQEFVYDCFEQQVGATSLYRQTPLTQPVSIYRQPVTGLTGVNLFDFTLSPDGTKIAVYLIDHVLRNTSTCEVSVSSRISTFDYAGKGFADAGVISSAVVQTGCRGGGDDHDINYLAYAPDGRSFAYLKMNGWSQLNKKLATLVPAQFSPTGQAVTTELANDVNDVSW